MRLGSIRNCGLVTKVFASPEPHIDVARNNLCETAINSNIQWLLMLDSDLIPVKDVIPRLLRHGKDFVSGLYARRHHPYWNEMLREQNGSLVSIPEGGYPRGELIEVDAVGTGCLLMRTEALKRIPKPLFLWTQSFATVGRCVLPNQSVLGGSPIQDVKIGEKIYNGYGNESLVTNIFEKPYEGDVVSITRSGLRLPVKITPEHNVLTLQNVKRSNIMTHQYHEPTRYQGRTWNFDEVREKWVPARDLRPNDWVGFPMLERKIGMDQLLIHNSSKTHVPKSIPITNDLAYLLGLYFAEGSASTHHITFALNMKTELELARKIVQLLEDVFLVKAKIRYGDRAILAETTSHPLARALHRWFGTNARNKTVPKWIFECGDPDIWKSFLIGIYHGDGYLTYSGIAKHKMIGFNLATKEGALGIFSLLVSLGIRPTLRRYIQPESAFGHGNPIYHVKILNDFDRVAELFGESPTHSRKQNIEKSFFHNNHLWMKIDSMTIEHYGGVVHDLTVQDRNSYVLEGMTVHNSEDFSFFQKIRSLGLKVFCDTSCLCRHVFQGKVVPSRDVNHPTFEPLQLSGLFED